MTDTFEWDYETRMMDAEIDSVESSYVYPSASLRAGSAAGLPVVLQDSEDNTYIYGLDLIARVDGQGHEEYYLYDGLGSATGICDHTGTVIATYEYDVFGAPRATTGSSANEFTFAEEQTDISCAPTGAASTANDRWWTSRSSRQRPGG